MPASGPRARVGGVAQAVADEADCQDGASDSDSKLPRTIRANSIQIPELRSLLTIVSGKPGYALGPFEGLEVRR